MHGKQMPMTVEEEPYLNAYWGLSTFETISHQSINLRIPAVCVCVCVCVCVRVCVCMCVCVCVCVYL